MSGDTQQRHREVAAELGLLKIVSYSSPIGSQAPSHPKASAGKRQVPQFGLLKLICTWRLAPWTGHEVGGAWALWSPQSQGGRPLSALLFPLRLRDPYSLTKQKCFSSVAENGFHSLTPFSLHRQPLGTSVSPFTSPVTEALFHWILIMLHLEQKAHPDTKNCSRETHPRQKTLWSPSNKSILKNILYFKSYHCNNSGLFLDSFPSVWLNHL